MQSQHQEFQYLDLLKRILDYGQEKTDRTNTGTISLFGEKMEFDISKEIPILTTKKVFYEKVLIELLWFLSGSTDVKKLKEQNVNFWNDNATRKFLDNRGLQHLEEDDLGACFPKNTPVLTKDGYKNIENIQKGDMVYTHLGNWKPVEQTLSRFYTGKMIEITCNGIPSFTCTSEHPLYVFDSFKLDFCWKKAYLIKEGDILAVKNFENKLKENDNINWYFIGRIFETFWFEGSTLFYLIPEGYAPMMYSEKVEKTKDDYIIYKTSNLYCKPLLEDLKNKNIPEWMFHLPTSNILYFLDGYKKDEEVVKTGFLKVALSLQLLYLRVGVNVDIVKKDNMYYLEENKSKQNIKIGDYKPVRVNKVSSWETKDRKVYNLEVKDDNSYVVNNVSVHNCYGFQWRHFGAEYKTCKDDYTGQGTDQIKEIIRLLREDPFSRRIILNAWNAADLNNMALPPCHMFAQFNVVEIDGQKYLDCMMTQRSGDMFLGVPFNIACYSMLTYMLAHITGMKPRKFVHIIGDAHIYKNHIEQAKKQLERKPYTFPTMQFSRVVKDIDDFKKEDIVIENYRCHPYIKAPMAV